MNYFMKEKIEKKCMNLRQKICYFLLGLGLTVFSICLLLFFNFESLPEPLNFFLYIILFSFSVIFILSIFLANNNVLQWLDEKLYTDRKKSIDKILDSAISNKQDVAGILLLSIIITIFTVYLLSTASLQAVFVFIPGSDLLQDVADPCESVSSLLRKTNGISISLITLVGPIWIFFIRQIRSYKRNQSLKTLVGSRSILVYIYLIILFMISNELFESECEKNLPPGIYSLPPTLQVYIVNNLIISLFYGIPISLFVIFLEKFVIPRFYKESL